MIGTKNSLKLEIRARQASLQPPIGPILGQYGIPGAKFCQDFNEQTKIYDQDIILSVKIKLLKKKIQSITWLPNISKILQRLRYLEPLKDSELEKEIDLELNLDEYLNDIRLKIDNLKLLSTKTSTFKRILKKKRKRSIRKSKIKAGLLIKKVRKIKKKKNFISSSTPLRPNYIYIEDIYNLHLRLNKANIRISIKELLGSLSSMQVKIIRL